MLLDLHTHSKYSHDALTKPETMIKICKKNNWGIAVTDHDTFKVHEGENRISQMAKAFDVFVIPGQEVTVFGEDGKIIGEVVVYFNQYLIHKAPFEVILDQIKEQDALISCPHPFDWPRKRFKDFEKEWQKFDCMETYNARAYYQGLNKKAKEFAEWREIAQLGVSDAHTPEEIGNGLTKIDAMNENEFRKQIKKKKTSVVINKKAKLYHHFQTQLVKRKLIKER
jgi:predicted metal-dependent phosphoesterase TrpH